jgi:hypothetical protein
VNLKCPFDYFIVVSLSLLSEIVAFADYVGSALKHLPLPDRDRCGMDTQTTGNLGDGLIILNRGQGNLGFKLRTVFLIFSIASSSF